MATMVDIQTLDTTEYPSFVELSLKAARDLGFRGKIDPETLEGRLQLHGVGVAFTIGEENLYLSLPTVFFKDGAAQGLAAVKQLLDAVIDFGGALP